MDRYFVILDPYSQQQDVFIYNENTDTFYTALRAGAKIDFKRNLIQLFITCIIIVGLFLASSLLDPFFLNMQPIFGISIYVGALIPISIITIFYCKRAARKMANSLQASQYENIDLHVLDNLKTFQQRRKFFHKLKWRRNVVQVISRFVVCPILWFGVTLWGIQQSRMFFLLLSLAMVSIFINLVFCEITDHRNCTDLKYLLQKFASKDE